MALRKRRVLVLDGDMVPSLTISRSLYGRGCEVVMGSHTHNPLGGYSNAVASKVIYPNPLAMADEFVQWLEDHLKTHTYDLVVPVTERVLVPLSRARARFEGTRIAMPAQDSLEVALDKSRTLALAAQVGVPGPGSTEIHHIEELVDVAGGLHYPVVIKPARSIGSGERGASQLQVSYAFDLDELESGCTHALRFGPVILQEYFAGQGVGIELIAQQGEIIYAFQHLRLHEVPLTGGGSSLRKSEPVNPVLLEASEKLISALKWNGVAMVEFKLDPATGEFCLMEINGRFWGSLPLAVAAGADFPSMLLDLEVEGRVHPCEPYHENTWCRLLSRDMYWYEAVLRADTDTRIVQVPSGTQVMKELGLFLKWHHRFDVQSLRDPLPGLVDIGRLFSEYTGRFLALYEEVRFRSGQRNAWRSGDVSNAIARARSILFLCYGNINRSALADVLVRAYAEDSGIEIISAGFHEEEGRPADPVMIDVAAQFDQDMHSLRSSCVTDQQLHDSDVIFVMEKRHYDKLVERDSRLSEKVFLLGAHHSRPGRSVEISDPYGRAREAYEACYEQIMEATDCIKGVIAVRGADQDLVS